MFRTVASFTLASLSLLTSYAIVAAWPDHPIASRSTIAAVAPVEAVPVAGLAVGGLPVTAQAQPTIVGLVD
jgi:hypothetical protein